MSFTNPSIEYVIEAVDGARWSASISGSLQLRSWWFADANSDGEVDIVDIAMIAGHFGETG